MYLQDDVALSWIKANHMALTSITKEGDIA